MTYVRKLMVVFLVALIGLSGAATAATLSWDHANGKTITFGKSYKGGGPSRLRLKDAKAGFEGQLVYVNKINRPQCFFIFCRRATPKKHAFSVYDNGLLVSKGFVSVVPSINPGSDLFRMKIKYAANGYHWVGKMKRRVCEDCRYTVRLMGPKVSGPTPSPVPLPAGVWMLLAGLAGLGLARRRRA